MLGLGAVAVFVFSFAGRHFLAHPWQLGLSVLAAALAVLVAFLIKPVPVPVPASDRRTASRTAAAALVGLVLTVGWQVVRRTEVLGPTVVVLLQVALVLAAVLVARVGRLPFGLAVGALATYGGVGLTTAVPLGPVATTEQVGIVAITAAVAVLAWRRSRVPRRVPDRPDSVPTSPTPVPSRRGAR